MIDVLGYIYSNNINNVVYITYSYGEKKIGLFKTIR